MYYFFAILIALVAFVNVVVHSKAKAAERPPAQGYYDQQLLNYRYTEFCSLGKVPAPLLDAVKQAFEKDPKTWGSTAEFLQGILEKQGAAKCGDA